MHMPKKEQSLEKRFEHFEVYRALSEKGIPVPVTSKWIADYLGISTMCLSLWRKKGYGPKYTRIGKNVRYDFKDFLDFLHNGQQEPAKEFPEIF
jgi:hypothetical protein